MKPILLKTILENKELEAITKEYLKSHKLSHAFLTSEGVAIYPKDFIKILSFGKKHNLLSLKDLKQLKYHEFI